MAVATSNCGGCGKFGGDCEVEVGREESRSFWKVRVSSPFADGDAASRVNVSTGKDKAGYFIVKSWFPNTTAEQGKKESRLSRTLRCKQIEFSSALMSTSSIGCPPKNVMAFSLPDHFHAMIDWSRHHVRG